MTDNYTLIPDFKEEIKSFFDDFQNYIILGVNFNIDSLSYKIFNKLKDDFIVFPVDKKTPGIFGLKCYAEITECPQKPEAAIIVSDIKNTLHACQECFNNNILNIWIEMGSESKEALDFCKKNNINTIFLHSILREKINRLQNK